MGVVNTEMVASCVWNMGGGIYEIGGIVIWRVFNIAKTNKQKQP